MQATLKKPLLDHASHPYRPTGYFNYRWARGKLGNDPVFAALLRMQVFASGARVLDLGCGRGLLAAWFLAAEAMAARGYWNAQPAPPQQLQFRGVELMAREADCGNQALQPLYGERVQLQGGAMQDADLSDCQSIVILDVLHYLPIAAQDRMLDRIRAALPSGGQLVTRIGNADGGTGFRISQLVDRCMAFAQGHRLERMWCRPLSAWVAALEARGFAVQATPMSAGTPFANVLLVARLA
jgi:SAM-dependent methyltransferase